jgi:hypothetical protein
MRKVLPSDDEAGFRAIPTSCCRFWPTARPITSAGARAWRSQSGRCPPASPTSRGSCLFKLSGTNVASPADADRVIGCSEQTD